MRIIKYNDEFVTLYDHYPRGTLMDFVSRSWKGIKDPKQRVRILKAEVSAAMDTYNNEDQFQILKLYSEMNDKHLDALYKKVKPMFELYGVKDPMVAKKFACFYYGNDFNDSKGRPIKGRLAQLTEMWAKDTGGSRQPMVKAHEVINGKVKNRRTNK